MAIKSIINRSLLLYWAMFCLLGCSDRFYHGMYDGLHHQNTHSGEVRFPQPTKPYDQYKAEREETFTDMK